MDSDTGRWAGTIVLAVLLLLDFIMTVFHAALDATSETELQTAFQEAGRDADGARGHGPEEVSPGGGVRDRP